MTARFVTKQSFFVAANLLESGLNRIIIEKK